MIQAWSGLTIETQTWIALSITWCMLVVSATIREKTPAGECRNWARAMGVVAVGLISLQTLRVTMLVQELNTELMVRRGSHNVEKTEALATQIADPVRVVAVASEFSQDFGSYKVSVEKYRDGRYGPVSITAGRFGGVGEPDSSTRKPTTGSGRTWRAENGSVGSVQELGKRF